MMKLPAIRAYLTRALPGIVVAAFAIMPVFTYFKTNFSDLQWVGVTGLLLFAVTVALVLWVLAWPFTRDWRRAAILGVLLTFPFFHFQEILGWLAQWVAEYQRQTIVVYVGVLLLAVPIGWLLRKPKERTIGTILNYLAVVAVVFFAWHAVGMVRTAIENGGTSVRVVNEDLASAPRTPLTGRQPDIYYLIFDRYTGAAELRERFGFDNSAFLDALRKRGFYVPERSFANYPVTSSSLASSLNAGLLVSKGPVERSHAAKPLYPLLKQPAVPAYLQSRGYEFVHIGSWWGPTMRSEIADRNPKTAWELELFGRKTYLGDLSGVFINKTMFRDLFEKLPTSRSTLFDNHDPAFRTQVSDVTRLAAEHGGRPKFVFTHFLMPHPPYIFDADGSRGYPPGMQGGEKYIRQLRYTNTEILRMVDAILRNDMGNPPIIILQADEGEYPTRFTTDRDPSDAEVRQKTSILNAYYFPGRRYDTLYEDITPVNTFRAVLNEFFGTDLAREPDRTYTLGGRYNFLDFVDVTERVRRNPPEARQE